MARPDFRAAAARRLSEERELSPAIVSLLSSESAGDRVGVRVVPVDRIEPNPDQPRLAFDEDTLDELAASIREHGVLQPILVRPLGAEPLPADRRRAPLARVASRPASTTIPALVEEIDDETALEISIIENLQREDLSPLDEATMYDRMIREHGYSIRKLAEKLGKDKGYLENRLRLADAPEEIRELVSVRKDTLSHAYELLKVEDPKKRRTPGRPGRAAASCRWSSCARRSRAAGAAPTPATEPTTTTARSRTRPARRRASEDDAAGWTADQRPRCRSATTRSSPPSSSWPRRSRTWSSVLRAPDVMRLDPRRRPREPRQVPDDRQAQARERDRHRPERRRPADRGPRSGRPARAPSVAHPSRRRSRASRPPRARQARSRPPSARHAQLATGAASSAGPPASAASHAVARTRPDRRADDRAGRPRRGATARAARRDQRRRGRARRVSPTSARRAEPRARSTTTRRGPVPLDVDQGVADRQRRAREERPPAARTSERRGQRPGRRRASA